MEPRGWRGHAAALLAPAASITVVSDRESDFYELFAERPANLQLIVRACQNRRIALPAPEGDGLLFSFGEGLPEQGRFVVTIPAAPGRKARTAELAVRYAPVVLRKPLNGADPALPATVAVTLVDVRETATPPDGGEPVHWRLLTTHIVTAPAQARRVIDVYRRRWIIEEFFRTLKTAGFDIEAADIGEPQAMINFVAAATIAAVTVKQLVQARDGNTDQRLTDAFDPAMQSPPQGLSRLRRLGHRPPRRLDRLLRQARTPGHATRPPRLPSDQVRNYFGASRCVNPTALQGGERRVRGSRRHSQLGSARRFGALQPSAQHCRGVTRAPLAARAAMRACRRPSRLRRGR